MFLMHVQYCSNIKVKQASMHYLFSIWYSNLLKLWRVESAGRRQCKKPLSVMKRVAKRRTASLLRTFNFFLHSMIDLPLLTYCHVLVLT